jgi:hypothetical protein
MTSTDSFTPGQIVRIEDYPNSTSHDPRTGEEATVTSTYNGLVYVNRKGYPETFVPARLTIVS